MARYIDAEPLIQKLSRMIDYCEKNKDKKFNVLNALFQVGDAIMDCPTADVVPKSEVEKIFAEIEKFNRKPLPECQPVYIIKERELAELKKKYTEGKE